jgi:hypothetical protein
MQDNLKIRSINMRKGIFLIIIILFTFPLFSCQNEFKIFEGTWENGDEGYYIFKNNNIDLYRIDSTIPDIKGVFSLEKDITTDNDIINFTITHFNGATISWWIGSGKDRWLTKEEFTQFVAQDDDWFFRDYTDVDSYYRSYSMYFKIDEQNLTLGNIPDSSYATFLPIARVYTKR